MAWLRKLFRREKEVPFMLDGPEMEYTPPWTAFTLRQGDGNTGCRLRLTVTDGDPDALVTGNCRDEKGDALEAETGIPISAETLQMLWRLGLEQLAEAPPAGKADEGKGLFVTLPDGTVKHMNAPEALSLEIYQLLLPYFMNNHS